MSAMVDQPMSPMARFIDSSPADDRTPEDAVAAGGPAPWPVECCDECGIDVNANEGWCRCVGAGRSL